MKIIFNIFISFIVLLFFISFTGCKKSPTSSSDPQIERGSWAIYTPYDWSHDGKAYQSTYCTIYSDAADDAMKQQLAKIADENFLEIMQLFNFQKQSDFIYPSGNSKVEVYLNLNHSENINWAYLGGFIITIRSPEISNQWIEYTVYTARHELTHVFEFLIEGKDDLGTDVWFREGLAVHSGCMATTIFKKITSLAELETWISENQNDSENVNPIGIHQHSDFPDGAVINDYYSIFELAMRYIVDTKGMGKSYEDVLNVFYDIRNGVPFSTSFSENIGVSLEYFENNFYDSVKTYLSS